MKKGIVMLAVLITSTALTGCCLKHQWEEASCTIPKTCNECGKTEGEVLGHNWQEATCDLPKTCSQCGETEGNALGHDWQAATCEAAKICSLCGKTEGKSLEHDWIEANYQSPKTCKTCLITEGEKQPGFFEKKGIEFNGKLDTKYDFTTYTPDGKLPVNIKVKVSDYKKFESDETHEKKDGYEWRTWKVTYSDKDSNGHNYGYTIGSGFADVYKGIIDAEIDENGNFSWGDFEFVNNIVQGNVNVNINGEEYETSVRIESEITSELITHTMSWLVPVEYDSSILYVYNQKCANPKTIDEFLADVNNTFLFFKLE